MESFRATDIRFESFRKSLSHPRWLAAFSLTFVLLSACSTKIQTDTSGASVGTGGDLTNNQNYSTDNSGNGSSTYTPNLTNNYPLPNSAGTSVTNTTPLNCYISRPGGYFPVGMPIPWQFGTDSGEALEVVFIGADEPWVTQPNYPLPASFSIYFRSPGVKKLSFLVRSQSDPNRYCNQGYRIYDQVVINPGY